MLIEGVPKSIDLNDIINIVENITGILSVHDLHVWSITSGKNTLSSYVVVDEDLTVQDSQKLLRLIDLTLLFNWKTRNIHTAIL